MVALTIVGRLQKRWPGLILPGRVTSLGCFSPPVIPILKLMYGHSYCGKHVSKEGVVGMTSETSKSAAKSGEELLVYEVSRKKLLTEFLGL